MPSLTLITRTRHNRPELLSRCIQSVEPCLTQNIKHSIITCDKDIHKETYHALLCDEYVACVDDDDTINPDVLSQCIAAIEHHPSAGIICTNERTVDIMGNTIGERTGTKTYQKIYHAPREIHHLCIIKSSAIDPMVLKMANNIGFGIEWYAKASAGLIQGAIHIDQIGYNWTIHENSLTATDLNSQYRMRLPAISKILHDKYGDRRGNIPTFANLKETHKPTNITS